MENHEEILLIRTEKFLVNLKNKHPVLSANFVNNLDKIMEYLNTYEIGIKTLDRLYEFIYWAESHKNIKEVETAFKELVDTFWE